MAGTKSSFDPRHSFDRSDEDQKPSARKGRKVAPPLHLEDHVWDSIDGWLDAEAENGRNRQRAVDAAAKGESYCVPRIPHRRTATLRPVHKNTPFEHVPYEDPALWEKANHFKRFASRPELVHDNVWACTGYRVEGLPEALRKLLPAHSALLRGASRDANGNVNLRNAALDQLVADGAMPAPLPHQRKLWAFQRRELNLGKKLAVPPRPPETLSDKYPDYTIVENPRSATSPTTTSSASCGHHHHHRPPRDSCVGGCCPTCGTNLKPWVPRPPQATAAAAAGRRPCSAAPLPTGRASSASATRPQQSQQPPLQHRAATPLAAGVPSSSTAARIVAATAAAANGGSALPAIAAGSDGNEYLHISRSRSVVAPKKVRPQLCTTQMSANASFVKNFAKVGPAGLKY